MSKINNFSHRTPIPAKTVVFGYAQREKVRLISHEIIFQVVISQHYRQTDGQTTFHGNTALYVASRGKNVPLLKGKRNVFYMTT